MSEPTYMHPAYHAYLALYAHLIGWVDLSVGEARMSAQSALYISEEEEEALFAQYLADSREARDDSASPAAERLDLYCA